MPRINSITLIKIVHIYRSGGLIVSYPYTETDNKEMWDEYFTALEGILQEA